MELDLIMDFEKSKINAKKVIKNETVLKHVLEIIETGITIIPANTDFLDVVNSSIEGYYDFKTANDHIVKEFENESGHLHRIVNLHEKVLKLNPLYDSNKTSMQVLDYFLKETIIYTSLFYERGSGQDLHRDTPYFCTQPEYRYMGFWIALENTDESNGTLQVVKGAHRLPELDREKISKKFYSEFEDINPFDNNLWETYQSQLKEQWENANLKVETINLNKGDSVIWHPQTPHGGLEILDKSKTRLSFVMHVTPPDTPVYHQDIFFSNKRNLDKVAWRYKDSNGRKYISHGMISFAHIKDYLLDDLK